MLRLVIRLGPEMVYEKERRDCEGTRAKLFVSFSRDIVAPAG